LVRALVPGARGALVRATLSSIASSRSSQTSMAGLLSRPMQVVPASAPHSGQWA
jgi:hypothetical protein